MGDRPVTYDGFTSNALAARLAIDTLRCLAQVGSTLDVVHDLAEAGAETGAVVLANEQTRGRGRHGRHWHSPPGAGIWLGYLHRLRTSRDPGVLSLRVGVGVARAVAALGVRPALKWPNDVLVADRKLAGILCEGRSADGSPWIAVGVGMNVHGPLPDELRAAATTLDEHVPGATRVAVLERLLPELRTLSAAPRLDPAESDELDRIDWLRDRSLAAPRPGIARGIADDGALLVETDTGLARVVGDSVRLA